MTTPPIIVAAALLLSGCVHRVPPEVLAVAPARVDLDDPDQALRSFVRVRASDDPKQEVFFHFSGSIHELRPGQAPPSRGPLLRFEGFNVARTVRLEDGGWRLISREIIVYQDTDGRIIDCWADPSVAPGDASRPVFHGQNDPVSFDLGAPPHAVLDDRVLWSLALPLAYPSPLTVAEHPRHSAGDLYQSVELFDFEASLDALDAPDSPSVPARISWSRTGQWLPWMGRGQRPGWLVYHATGHKLEAGWDDLPGELRGWVLEHAPRFQHAPERDVGPNQTSWSAFGQAVSAGEIPEACAASE
jgi:hypothetical protein